MGLAFGMAGGDLPFAKRPFSRHARSFGQTCTKALRFPGRTVGIEDARIAIVQIPFVGLGWIRSSLAPARRIKPL
jgi:hypothetical protein